MTFRIMNNCYTMTFSKTNIIMSFKLKFMCSTNIVSIFRSYSF